MGLDMHLFRKTYVKNWDHMGLKERHEITILKGGKPRTDIKPERIYEIVEEVAYWRKANHIHKWFVDNVQKGRDDCGDYAVDVEQLEELLAICKKVLASTKLVAGSVHTGTTYTADENGPHRTENYEEGMIVQDSSVAEQLLPTRDGFFFGGTDYDQWYVEDIEYTIKTLEELLAEEKQGRYEYVYHSSW